MAASAPERSTALIEVTLKDSDGSLIDVGAITAFTLEVHGSDPGAANPIISSTAIPTANPYKFVLDLTPFDMSVVGEVLYVEYKVVYNSLLLGNGAVMRSTPFEIYLTDSRIAT